MDSIHDESMHETLTSACRTAIGDDLRSIVLFTHDEFEQVYLRSDLDAGADIETFVANERVGFDRLETYEGSELGGYQYTIHGFDDGFLVRVVAEDYGVFVTTDSLTMRLFEEVVIAVRKVLSSE